MQRSLQQAAVAPGSVRGVSQHKPASSSSCAGRSTADITIIKSTAARSSNGYVRIRVQKDGTSVIAKQTSPGDAFHALHLQEAEAGAVLPEHSLIMKPLAFTYDDYSLQTLHQTGPTLVSYHKQCWERCGDDIYLPLYKVVPVAEELAACAVDALCHLSRHNVIHGAINEEAFFIWKEKTTGKLVVKLAEFGCSYFNGIAHAPGATDLATIPHELCYTSFMRMKGFIKYAEASFDIWGLGTLLLGFISPDGPPAVHAAETWGIEGEFSDLANLRALRKASNALHFSDVWAWVRDNYPPQTLFLLERRPILADFIARCLTHASERWSAAEAAEHPLVRGHIASLPEACTRLAQQQEPAIQAIANAGPSLFKELSEACSKSSAKSAPAFKPAPACTPASPSSTSKTVASDADTPSTASTASAPKTAPTSASSSPGAIAGVSLTIQVPVPPLGNDSNSSTSSCDGADFTFDCSPSSSEDCVTPRCAGSPTAGADMVKPASSASVSMVGSACVAAAGAEAVAMKTRKGPCRLRSLLRAIATGFVVRGGNSSSSSSPVSAVPTPALAGGAGALRRQGSSSSSSSNSSAGSRASSGAVPSRMIAVVAAAAEVCKLRMPIMLMCVAMGPVSVEGAHLSIADAAKCAGALITKCHRVTGEMPCPMLMVQFAPTLTCPQSEVVPGPMVASSGGSSSAVSVSGKACKLLRAARSVCRFFVRR